MVFPSGPFYLDPPNWNQQQAQQAGSGSGSGGDVHQLPPRADPHPEGGMGGPVRPGSTADRARLTRAPQPEPALKCPRCDSINTKFCYFNNYSLSQPRHFCKTCRRYWTRGGALRSVPVGGGCRRNKRSKSSGSSSKSQAATTMASSSSAATAFASGAVQPTIPPAPQLPFMASMHHTADYATPNFDLNFAGIQPMDAVNYQVGGSSSSGLDQWRLQQFQHFPLFGGLEPPAPATAYPFDREGGGVDGAGFAGQFHATASSSGLAKQMASVKMEDNPQGLNLARQFMGFPGRNTQYWGGGGGGGSVSGGGGWMADLSGFNPSSSGNPL